MPPFLMLIFVKQINKNVDINLTLSENAFILSLIKLINCEKYRCNRINLIWKEKCPKYFNLQVFTIFLYFRCKEFLQVYRFKKVNHFQPEAKV